MDAGPPPFDCLPDDARDWIHRHAPGALSGATLVRDTPRSVVLRLTSGVDVLYFKADRILPPAEASILLRLARVHPDRLAPLVAVDEERGWSLTRDVGPPGLDLATTAEWCAVVRQFAQLQRSTGLSADQWVRLGCRDFRGPRLFDEIDAMIRHASADLEAAERDALSAQRPRIREACDDLASDGIPATLVHQDLVPENLVWGENRAVFLDWSDTVVGHPFFGLDRLLDSCWTDGERKSAVIDAYLAEFAGVASLERRRESSGRVLSLRVLYEDLRWHHEIAAVAPDSEHARRLRADQLQGLRMVASRRP